MISEKGSSKPAAEDPRSAASAAAWCGVHHCRCCSAAKAGEEAEITAAAAVGVESGDRQRPPPSEGVASPARACCALPPGVVSGLSMTSL